MQLSADWYRPKLLRQNDLSRHILSILVRCQLNSLPVGACVPRKLFHRDRSITNGAVQIVLVVCTWLIDLIHEHPNPLVAEPRRRCPSPSIFPLDWRGCPRESL